MRPEQAGIRPDRSAQTHHNRAERCTGDVAAESQPQEEQAYSGQCDRQSHRTCAHHVRQCDQPWWRLRVQSRQSQCGSCHHGERHGKKHEPWRFFRVVVSLEMRLVVSVVVVGVDLQRMALDDGAKQIEARVLIPTAAFVKINKREKDYATEQECGFPVRSSLCRERSHHVPGSWGSPSNAGDGRSRQSSGDAKHAHGLAIAAINWVTSFFVSPSIAVSIAVAGCAEPSAVTTFPFSPT